MCPKGNRVFYRVVHGVVHVVLHGVGVSVFNFPFGECKLRTLMIVSILDLCQTIITVAGTANGQD